MSQHLRDRRYGKAFAVFLQAWILAGIATIPCIAYCFSKDSGRAGDPFGITAGLLIILFGVFLYPFPAILACISGHPRRKIIYRVNWLLGWTVVGWIVAFVWTLIGYSSRRAVQKHIAPVPQDVAEPLAASSLATGIAPDPIQRSQPKVRPKRRSAMRKHPFASALTAFVIAFFIFAWWADENAPQHKKLDYTLPVYTVEGAIVCPKTLILGILTDPNAVEREHDIFEAFTSFTGREEKTRAAGCDTWDGGVQVQAERMKEPFNTYVSINPVGRQGSFFTMEGNLTNGPAAEGSTSANKLAALVAASPTLGRALVANPSSKPIPTGNVVASKDGFGAVICPDSATLAAYDDEAIAAFTSNSSAAPDASIFGPIAKSHGCSFVPSGTAMLSEGANSTASLAIVTAHLLDGTTVKGVTFPTMLTQAETPEAGAPIPPVPAPNGGQDDATPTQQPQ